MSKPTKVQITERDDARAALRALLSPGDTLHTILRHKARSGMSRTISVVVITSDGVPHEIDYLVAPALERKITRHGGVESHGAGMDFGFHLVYCLGKALWPDGTPKPHGKRNGQPDSDGGYALKQRWL